MTLSEVLKKYIPIRIEVLSAGFARGLSRGGLYYPTRFARKGPILPYEMFHTDTHTHTQRETFALLLG